MERVLMTQSCCPSCRLRFSRATAAHLAACPFCAVPLQNLRADAALGFRLLAIDGLVDEEPMHEPVIPFSVSLPPPDRPRPRIR
jgi:hypothetical protein